MVRVEEAEVPAIWKKLDQSDHFFHALGFMLAAMKMHNLQERTAENPQVAIGVWGVDTQGPNGLLGKKPKNNWNKGTPYSLVIGV